MNMIMLGGIIEDPRPSLISMVVQSAFGTDHSENENEKSKSQEDNRKWEEETFKEEMKVSSRLSTSQKLGWPLLRRMHTEISRDMSVVQWVMNLPDRSTHKYNNNRHSSSQIEGQSYKNVISFSSCKWFIFEVLNSCTSQFSSGRTKNITAAN